MSHIRSGIQKTCQKPLLELPRQAVNELHFVVEDSDDLLRLCEWARQQNYYLCTMVANDERALTDHAFKLYYVLSAPQENLLIILEHPLRNPQYPTQYVSIRKAFPAVESLEREAHDLVGVSPLEPRMADGFVLHLPYPPRLYPLRLNRPIKKLQEMIKNHVKISAKLARPEEGKLFLPVGPIHAGVIEAGHFQFHVAGEVIEDLTIRLGYKHKGIEKLFQTHHTLESGWELAERISGDSSFAHALAYCQAVEALAGLEPPEPALYWRGLLLEMERLYNHIGDVAALVHDMAFDLVAAEIAILRESVMQLNLGLTGHRLLRGVNRPGGVEFSGAPNLENLSAVADLTGRFLSLSKLVLHLPACRERTLTTGILTREEAQDFGATGLAARASGLWEHDFRLKHPQGVYARHPELLDDIRATVAQDDVSPTVHDRSVLVFQEELPGDVFARMALRVAEVETSARIIQRLFTELKKPGSRALRFVEPLTRALWEAPNFEFGLGFVEGWRGDIFYWVMKGPDNTIFRCKVRDPSLFNWPALRLATIRKPDKTDPAGKRYCENILADFPLINKSFNLSYSGHDL